MARDVRVKIVGDPTSYRKALKQSEKDTVSFEGAVKKSHTALAGMAAGMLGAGGVVIGLEKIIEVGKKSEESIGHLTVTMKDAGVSYTANRVQIEALIAKQSELAGFQKTDLRESYAALIRMTKDVGQANTDLALTVDIARGRHIDLATAQQIVIKASLGMTGALRRMGIDIVPVHDAMNALTDSHLKFTTAQKDAAKALDLAATKTKALGLLQKTYAGQAAEYGKSSAGAADRFKVSITNLEVTLSKALLPTLTNGLQHVTAWVNRMNDSGDAAKYAHKAADILSGTIHDATPIVKGSVKAFQGLADALGGDKQAVEALGGALAAWKLTSVLGGIGTSAGTSATKVGLLTSRLKTLGAIGVITVGIEVLIHRNQVDGVVNGIMDKITAFQQGGFTNNLAKSEAWIANQFGANVKWQDLTKSLAGRGGVGSGGSFVGGDAGSMATSALQTGSKQKNQGAAIAAVAATQLGISYQWGGPAILGQHTDCSGLAQAVLAKNGIHVGRTTYEQWTQGTPVTPGDLQAGDLVFFHMGAKGPEHVGIYIGNDQFIEDPHTGSSVRVSTLSTYPGFVGARRYTSVGASTATAPKPKDTTGTTAADIVKQGTSKTKKAPTLSGTKLLTHATQIALAKAGGTKTSADNLAALKKEQTELLAMPQSLAVTKQLAATRKEINAIETADTKAQLAAQQAAYKKHAQTVVAQIKSMDTAWKSHTAVLQKAAADAKAIFDRSFTEGEGALFTQFDRLTQMGLSNLVVAQTPEEKALADFQAQRAATDQAKTRADALANASTEERAALALGYSLDDQETALKAAADASRVAADKATADAQQQYQDKRDADRQALQDWLDDQKKALDDGKETWDQFYAALKDKASAGGFDIGQAFWDAWNAAAGASGDSTRASNIAANPGTGDRLQTLHDQVVAGTLDQATYQFLISGHKLEIPGFADGVSNFRGGLALVGERGPELVNLPGGSSVTPNGGALVADVPIVVQFGDDVLLSAVQRVILRNKKRNGASGLG